MPPHYEMSSILCTTPNMPLGVIATDNTSESINATLTGGAGASPILLNGGGKSSENIPRQGKTQLHFNNNSVNLKKPHTSSSSGGVMLPHFTGVCHQFEGSIQAKPSSSSTSTSSSLSQKSSSLKLIQSLEGGCHQLGPISTFAKKRMSKRKKISFLPHDQIIEIPKVSDLSPDEFKAVYMTREEMSAIHDECWRLVDLMNQGVEWEDTPGFSKRGLVDLKDVSVERRRKMRDQAYKIVFGVQKFHGGSIAKKGGGIHRPTNCVDVIDVTATLYAKAAARSQEEAYESAWFDSLAARV